MIICCIIQACFAVFFFYRLQTTGSAARVGYEDIATGARRDGPEDLGNSVLGISDINNVVVTRLNPVSTVPITGSLLGDGTCKSLPA
jgi:hypothetical protein